MNQHDTLSHSTAVISPTPVAPIRTAITGALVAFAVGVGCATNVSAGFGAVALTALVVGIWWPRLLGAPQPRSSAVVIIIGGALCVAAVASTTTEPRLRWVAIAFSASLLIAFGRQFARRTDRTGLVVSVAGEMTGILILASLSAVPALPRESAGDGGVLLWSATSAAALVIAALTTHRFRWALSVGAAFVAGVASGLVVDDGSAVAGVMTAIPVAVVVSLTHWLLLDSPGIKGRGSWLALGSVPVAASGTVGYVVLRLILA
ncbi:MAG: hypothetical protein ACRCTR_02470 [Actinomycetota bacterium]